MSLENDDYVEHRLRQKIKTWRHRRSRANVWNGAAFICKRDNVFKFALIASSGKYMCKIVVRWG